MGNPNDRHTVDAQAGILWEKSTDHVFAVAPVAWLPIAAKAARYSHLIIASADATEVHFNKIPLDGFDHDQVRKRLAAALDARGSCVIHNFDSEAELAEFCAATWPEQWAAQEAEPALAEKFPTLRKQIEAFVLDRAKEALGSSRIMNSNWREMLETISDFFASDMDELDASTSINQAKVRALGPINDAFSIGVLIGRSVSDDVVTQILAAGESARAVLARSMREVYDQYADAKLTDAVAKAVGPGKTPPPVSNSYVRSIESAVRDELKLANQEMIRKPAGWPKLSTIKKEVGRIASQRKGQR